MVKEICVDVFGSENDSDIIRLPNRKFPGVLIQGDSLAALFGAISDAINCLDTDQDESLEAMNFVREELKWRIETYQRVLNEHGAPFTLK